MVAHNENIPKGYKNRFIMHSIVTKGYFRGNYSQSIYYCSQREQMLVLPMTLVSKLIMGEELGGGMVFEI